MKNELVYFVPHIHKGKNRPENRLRCDSIRMCGEMLLDLPHRCQIYIRLNALAMVSMTVR